MSKKWEMNLKFLGRSRLYGICRGFEYLLPADDGTEPSCGTDSMFLQCIRIAVMNSKNIELFRHLKNHVHLISNLINDWTIQLVNIVFIIHLSI
jgi:hypothetical protein